MITLKYKLPNKTEPQFLTFEGRLFCDKNITEKISTSWNNENFDVQHIFSNSYRLECFVKESEFVAIQDLEYAYENFILLDGTYELFNFVSFSSEEIFAEFKKCTLLFAKNSQKEFSNLILHKTKNCELYVYSTASFPRILLFTADVYFEPIKKSDFTKNNVDNFASEIDDYYRNQIYYDIRLFFNETDYFDFLDSLQNSNYLELSTRKIGQPFEYTISANENIGKDLYMIDLKLISSTTITGIQ